MATRTTPPLESKFKKDFCKKLKALGCIPIQYQQNATTLKGFPDTICLGPESVVFFIEFKRSKHARFQPLQREWGEKLLAHNFFYYLVYPENADAVLTEIKEIL